MSLPCSAVLTACTVSKTDALMWAAQYNSVDAAKVLIKAGVDVNTRNNNGKTALIVAEDYGSEDMMELLEAVGVQ